MDDEQRALYHSAAVLASNYLVTLAALVQDAFGEIDPFIPLMEGTLANVRNLGTTRALTGPILRGDASTIERHIEALQDLAPAVAPYYRTLGVATAEQLAASGRLQGENAHRIIEALRRP